jgi:hypothetical protein
MGEMKLIQMYTDLEDLAMKKAGGTTPPASFWTKLMSARSGLRSKQLLSPCWERSKATAKESNFRSQSTITSHYLTRNFSPYFDILHFTLR